MIDTLSRYLKSKNCGSGSSSPSACWLSTVSAAIFRLPVSTDRSFAPVSVLQQSIFGLLDLFAGGAFAKATIFAMGIMPYISASIMLQLLGAVVPYLQRLQREGEEGRRKITQYTRYLTVLLPPCRRGAPPGSF